MKRILPLLVFLLSPVVSIAASDGSLGQIYMLWPAENAAQIKTECLRRDRASADQTTAAWEQWSVQNKAMLDDIAFNRVKLEAQMKRRAEDASSSSQQRQPPGNVFESLRNQITSALRQQMSGMNDRDMAQFCAMARSSWLSRDSKTSLEQIAQGLREALAEGAAGR